ncbi:MAG: DUF2997 domain-containing protein [Chloroflexi bacterium]|nr:DUF2997 domain-containing protein [Chloroflexota bacterium]
MSELEFTIDATSGRLELHVKGIAGPACDDVAKLVKDLMGEPAQEQNTTEYFVRTRVRPQVRPRRGQ